MFAGIGEGTPYFFCDALFMIQQALVKAEWGFTTAPNALEMAEPAALMPETPPRYTH